MTLTILLMASSGLFGQALPSTADVVDNFIVQGEYPRLRRLSTEEKRVAANTLTALRPKASGKQLQKISFVLAALGSDYKTNRNHTIDALRGCTTRQTNCDEDTANLLIGICFAGHREVLAPLLLAGHHSDGALSALLGAFYARALLSAPAAFIATLQHFSIANQKAVCSLAGGGDGGGINRVAFKQAHHTLMQVSNTTASQCLHHLAAAHKQAKAESKSSRD